MKKPRRKISGRTLRRSQPPSHIPTRAGRTVSSEVPEAASGKAPWMARPAARAVLWSNRHQARCGGGVVRAANLSAHFEAGDLFVLAHIAGIANIEEARRVLEAGPRLSFKGGWTSLVSLGREPRRLCPYDDDEVGCWPAGANRDCRDEFLAAALSMPDFMALLPEKSNFQPVWFAVSEWEKDTSGRAVRLIGSASGSIGTLALG